MLLRFAVLSSCLSYSGICGAQEPLSRLPEQADGHDQQRPSAPSSAELPGADEADESNPDDDKVELGDIASGRLARYGVTAGVALAVHLPINDDQKQIGTGALPYIEVLPLIWFIRGDISRAYCVAQLTDAPSAQEVADTVAERRTRKVTDKNAWQRLSRSSRTQKVHDETGWELGTPASGCALSWFGVYVGLPAEFDADSSINDSARQARDFKPLASFGMTFSPTSLIRLLAGITVSNVEDDTERNRTTTSLSLSLGGNLDIAGALIP